MSKGCLSNAEEDNEEIAKSSFQMLIGITMIEIYGIKGGRPDEHQVDKSVHPLRFRKSVACTGEGARKRGEGRRGESEGERARTPRAAVTVGTTSAMRQPTV